MKHSSIILKGDDQRVRRMDVQNLLGKKQAKPASDSGESGALEATGCETRVEVLRVEDQVRGVEVHCSCGEVTLIELTYPEAQPNTPA